MIENSERQGTEGRIVPVEQLRPGDHSCMDVTDVDDRWEVLTAYTWTGLARGEKVMVILDPGDLNDGDAIARLDGGTGHVEAAHTNGGISLLRSTPTYLPDGRFDIERLMIGFAEEIARTQVEGYPGLRATADMSWASRAGLDRAQLVDYETSAQTLFANPHFIGLCWYDREKFSDHLIAAVHKVHPLRVMDHLGLLEVASTSSGARISGSAGREARAEFTEGLREALEHAPLRFELDLTGLCFIETQCAWQLIDFAARLPEEHKIVVRCGPMHEMVLRGLGSDDVPQLEIQLEDGEATPIDRPAAVG